MCYEASIGTAFWIYNAEITNAKGVSLSIIVQWIFNLLIVAVFTVLAHVIGFEGVMFILAGTNLMLLIFSSKYMIETKGLTAYEIEHALVSI